MKGKVQCINCQKQRRCLLIIACMPIPFSEIEHRVWCTEEALRVAICRPCLKDAFHLGTYIADHAR